MAKSKLIGVEKIGVHFCKSYKEKQKGKIMKINTDNRTSRNNGTELIRLIDKAISCCRWRANFALSNASDYRKWKEKKKVLEDALEIAKEIRNAI